VKVVIFGASGMVGGSALRACCLDPDVTQVLVIARRPVGVSDPKVHELLVRDVGNLSAVEAEVAGYDACFWCLGVASAGMSEAEYRAVTHDLTVRAAATLARVNPGMTMIYVSGAGTDSTEKGRTMWARVKGQTENALLRMPFRAAYMFRPGLIRPMHGIRSKTRSYRWLYAVLLPFLVLTHAVAPNSMTTTDRIGRAMIQVVRIGAPERLLGTREINRLGA
jgi:uncharacterized protein YbjT (DUF2867 family)